MYSLPFSQGLAVQQESPKTYTVDAAKIMEGLEKYQSQLCRYVPELETRVRSVCQDRASGPPADGKHLGMASSLLLETHLLTLCEYLLPSFIKNVSHRSCPQMKVQARTGNKDSRCPPYSPHIHCCELTVPSLKTEGLGVELPLVLGNRRG